jgi:hypothetical protein
MPQPFGLRRAIVFPFFDCDDDDDVYYPKDWSLLISHPWILLVPLWLVYFFSPELKAAKRAIDLEP